MTDNGEKRVLKEKNKAMTIIIRLLAAGFMGVTLFAGNMIMDKINTNSDTLTEMGKSIDRIDSTLAARGWVDSLLCMKDNELDKRLAKLEGE